MTWTLTHTSHICTTLESARIAGLTCLMLRRVGHGEEWESQDEDRDDREEGHSESCIRLVVSERE